MSNTIIKDIYQSSTNELRKDLSLRVSKLKSQQSYCEPGGEMCHTIGVYIDTLVCVIIALDAHVAITMEENT